MYKYMLFGAIVIVTVIVGGCASKATPGQQAAMEAREKCEMEAKASGGDITRCHSAAQSRLQRDAAQEAMEHRPIPPTRVP
ncbi:MAG: hypothetical protein ACR2PJ_05255 [Pseudomonadales bacterium]